jgi:hypothetical protein
MSEPNRVPVPEPEKNPDADRPTVLGRGEPPASDAVQGPCACGGSHATANCPLPTA